MSHTSLRTQIYLPKDLREQIDKDRLVTGESLAEYLRKAAKLRVKKEKKKKQDLKKLVEEIFSKPIKNGAWEGVDVNRWHHDFRKAEDDHFLERTQIK